MPLTTEQKDLAQAARWFKGMGWEEAESGRCSAAAFSSAQPFLDEGGARMPRWQHAVSEFSCSRRMFDTSRLFLLRCQMATSTSHAAVGLCLQMTAMTCCLPSSSAPSTTRRRQRSCTKRSAQLPRLLGLHLQPPQHTLLSCRMPPSTGRPHPGGARHAGVIESSLLCNAM